MGGPGSGRWNYHSKKQTVEHSLGLPTTHLREGLNAVADGKTTLWFGELQWSRQGEVFSKIGFRIVEDRGWRLVNLIYITTHR